ncbi:MAG: ABC transporter substrate-binding protein [Acetatifactor sp.]|nr:ABC transporter substrate-binding protein [Acetatifactor sp.]
MKKITAILMTAALSCMLLACGSEKADSNANGEITYKVGICNYVDDASLNQIVDNIQDRLIQIGNEKNVVFDVKYDNCNADSNVLNQIVANFIADDVDLMVGVATPVAMAMQGATEENKIPVVFAAVSDPLATGLVDSLEVPSGNLTGTSDFLDTTAVMNLIFANDPEADNIALLYDMGQDASTTAIASAKAYLDEKNVSYKEYTGTTVDEVMLAADQMVADGVDAVFTPSDNTIMTAELSIFETLSEAGIPHYAGADSFALNGAFVGYGVDYANLGVETANMIAEILIDGKNVSETPVKTFDNGTATVNTEVTESLGLDLEAVKKAFEPYCSKVVEIKTAENFDDLNE